MLVDLNGTAQIFSSDVIINNFATDGDEPKYMVVPGCSLQNLEDKTPEQLTHFVQNEFTIKINNVLNPPIKEDTSVFGVEIYKSWDQDLNQGVDLISESTTFFFPMAAYDIEGGIIQDPLIITSSNLLGDSDGNIATISFTPATTLAQGSGYIEIETPDWAVLYDSSLKQAVIYYPNTGVTSCTSPSFTTTDISDTDEDHLFIKYTDLIGSNTQKITITCTNWRNPILPETVSGFTIKTLDAQKYTIDEAENFSFDGTALQSLSIERTDITYSTYMSLTGSLYGVSIEFQSPLDMQSGDGCYVKYNFPKTLDYQNIVFESIEGTNMFVDTDGLPRILDTTSFNYDLDDEE